SAGACCPGRAAPGRRSSCTKARRGSASPSIARGGNRPRRHCAIRRGARAPLFSGSVITKGTGCSCPRSGADRCGGRHTCTTRKTRPARRSPDEGRCVPEKLLDFLARIVRLALAPPAHEIFQIGIVAFRQDDPRGDEKVPGRALARHALALEAEGPAGTGP